MGSGGASRARHGQRSDRRPWVSAVVAGRALVACVSFVVPALAGAVATPPARVERVRYEATDNSTRVVVLLSRQVPYEVNVLAGDPARGSERRIVLDLTNARLGSGAAAPIGVENGILQRIRTGQFTARTTRVVLDVTSVTEHKVVALANPPRIVVDILGRPTRARPTQEAAVSSRRSAGEEAPLATSGPVVPVPAQPDVEPANVAANAGSSGAVAERRADVATPQATREADAHQKSPARAGTKRRLEGLRIVLDPGHGGHDPGAQGVDGVLEKDVTLAITRQLKQRLEREEGVTVLLTRNGDETRSLAERTAFANASSADVFISIHTNADHAGTLRGIETYTLNNTNDRATIRLAKMENGPAFRVGPGALSLILSDLVQSGKEEESNALAERLHSRLLARLRTRYSDVHNLGVKRGPFYVLVGAYMPCVLVETSFLSHPIEGRRLASSDYQEQVAEGLFAGIMDFVGDTRLAKTL